MGFELETPGLRCIVLASVPVDFFGHFGWGVSEILVLYDEKFQ